MSMWSKKTYKEIDEGAFINPTIIERIDFLEEDSILHDETWKVDSQNEQEMRHISELYRICENMNKQELLTICSLAVRKHPFGYLQVLAEYLIEIGKGKGK